MSELKFLWLGLNSDRERTVFLEGFWEGFAATEEMRKEAEQLERTASITNPVQYTFEQV